MARGSDPGAVLDKVLRKPKTASALLVLNAKSPMRPTALSKALSEYSAFGVFMGRHLAAHGWARMRSLPGRGDKPGYELSITDEGRRAAELLATLARTLRSKP